MSPQYHIVLNELLTTVHSSLKDDHEQLPWIDTLFQNRKYYATDFEEEYNPISFPSNNDFAPSSESPVIISDEEDWDNDSSQTEGIPSTLSK
jgi:hypothetical protein